MYIVLLINRFLTSVGVSIAQTTFETFLQENNEKRSHLDLSWFTQCIMGFIQFWINMADKEIKVHQQVIQIFPMIESKNKDRPACFTTMHMRKPSSAWGWPGYFPCRSFTSSKWLPRPKNSKINLNDSKIQLKALEKYDIFHYKIIVFF